MSRFLALLLFLALIGCSRRATVDVEDPEETPSRNDVPSLIEDLKDGTIDAMVVQDPFKMGFEAVKTLVDKLNGTTPPKRIDLPARVIRKSDLEKPDVHELLFPDVKK